MKGKSSFMRAKGGLFLIAFLLAGSGIIRLALHAGPALAREGTTLAETESDQQNSLAPIDFAAAIDALSKREARVEAEEKRLDQRLELLATAERQYQESHEQLIAAEQQLADTISQAETAMAKDVGQLAKVYEKMKAKDAAALFAQMDPDFAAGFLALVNSEVAAKILSGLEPQKAYAISVLLAGRNANVPSE